MRTVQRLVTRYRINPSLLTFLPRKRGPVSGSRRLDPERESIVEEAVERWLASREPLPISRAVEEVTRLAKAAGLQPVARDSIVRRLQSPPQVQCESVQMFRIHAEPLGSCRRITRP